MNFVKAKKKDYSKQTNDCNAKSMLAYNVAVRRMEHNKDDENYNRISSLVSQYSYGYCVHRELEDLLDKMGIKYEKMT